MFRRAKRYGILAGLVGSAAMAVAWASLLEACGKAGGALSDGGDAETTDAASSLSAEAASEDSALVDASDASSAGDAVAEGGDSAVKKDASVRNRVTVPPKHDRNLYRLPAE